MSAEIVCNATPGSLEVALAALTTLSNFDNTGVAGWQWTLKDKPLGSAAALSGSITSTVTLTPDVPGSYVVELRTYADAGHLVFDDVDLEEVRSRFAVGFDWVIPGAGETTQFDSSKGWKAEVNRIFTDLHDYILKPTALKIAAYSASYGELVMVNLAGAAGNVTITPLTAASVAGKRIGVKVVGAATGRQAIFDPPGAQTVDGAATSALTTDNAYASYESDGTNWQRVG